MAVANSSGPIDLLRQLSRQSSDLDTVNFSEELELLQNVYFDDLTVIGSFNSDKRCNLLFHITPSTGDDKEKQYVYCDVEFWIEDKYPSVRPDISIKQSRGLSDAHTISIMEGLLHLSVTNIGSPMIYDLVEYVRDSLTHNNRPCGKCAICQWDFQEDDQFLRTECYHYFHPSCLSSYVHNELVANNIKKSEREANTLPHETAPVHELECPVCRVVIQSTDSCLVNIDSIDLAISEEDNEPPIQLDSKLLQWQQDMSVLYQKQLKQGGIIDLTLGDATIDEDWVSPSSLVTVERTDELHVSHDNNHQKEEDNVIEEEEKDHDSMPHKSDLVKEKNLIKINEDSSTQFRNKPNDSKGGRKWKPRERDWKQNGRDKHYYREDSRMSENRYSSTDTRWRHGRYRPRYNEQYTTGSHRRKQDDEYYSQMYHKYNDTRYKSSNFQKHPRQKGQAEEKSKGQIEEDSVQTGVGPDCAAQKGQTERDIHIGQINDKGQAKGQKGQIEGGTVQKGQGKGDSLHKCQTEGNTVWKREKRQPEEGPIQKGQLKEGPIQKGQSIQITPYQVQKDHFEVRSTQIEKGHEGKIKCDSVTAQTSSDKNDIMEDTGVVKTSTERQHKSSPQQSKRRNYKWRQHVHTSGSKIGTNGGRVQTSSQSHAYTSESRSCTTKSTTSKESHGDEESLRSDIPSPVEVEKDTTKSTSSLDEGTHRKQEQRRRNEYEQRCHDSSKNDSTNSRRQDRRRWDEYERSHDSRDSRETSSNYRRRRNNKGNNNKFETDKS